MDITIADRRHTSVESMRGRLREINEEHRGERLAGDAQAEWNELVTVLDQFEVRDEWAGTPSGNLTADSVRGGGDPVDAFTRDLFANIQEVGLKREEVFSYTAGDWAERALTTANTSTSQQAAGVTLFEVLRPASIAIQSGVGTYVVSAESESVPVQTGSGTASWTAEAATITASDPIFSATTVTPHKLAAIVRLSNDLIEDSNPDILDVLRRELLATAGSELDRAFFLGTGANDQPLGIHFQNGIQTQTFGAIATTGFNGAGSAIAKLEAVDAPRPYALACNPSLVQKYRALRGGTASQDAYLWPTSQADPPQLWGAGIYTSTQLVAGTAYAFAPSRCYIAQRTPFQIEVDRSRLFNSDESEVRLRGRFDVFVPNTDVVVRGESIS